MSMERREPKDPTRVKNFARFFKGYMNIWSIVTASLPIPLTAVGAIPTFKVQTWTLSTYSSLFCFLVLGFIFYSRHQLARFMFPEYFGGEMAYSTPGFVKAFNLAGVIHIGRVTWANFIAFLPNHSYIDIRLLCI